MKDTLFDTDEKQKEAVANARSFIVQPFWATFKKMVETKVALLRHQLESGEFKDLKEVEKMQEKISTYLDVMGIPDFVIEAFDPNEQQSDEPNLDPFESIEDFRTDLRKQRANS